MLLHIMDYQYKLKHIYCSSKIILNFSDHIIDVFDKKGFHQKITHDMACLMGVNHPLTSTHFEIYPKYLEYPKEINHDNFIELIHEFPSKRSKNILKKEILRFIFLFTLCKYLKFSYYNVDFFAYRHIDFNAIQFTTDYQFFDTLCENFFKQRDSIC